MNGRCVFRCNRFGAAGVESADRGYHVGSIEEVFSYSVTADGFAVEGVSGCEVKCKQSKLGVTTFSRLVQEENCGVAVLRVVRGNIVGSSNAGIKTELDVE